MAPEPIEVGEDIEGLEDLYQVRPLALLICHVLDAAPAALVAKLPTTIQVASPAQVTTN